MCVCMYCMCGHSVSKNTPFSSLHFTKTPNSFCTDMYDPETSMIKQKIQKTNTEHLKSLRTEGIFFQHNTSQETTGSDLHHITSRFFLSFLHFCLFFSLPSTGTTAPCTPSILCLIFSPCIPPETPSDKQCLFDINRLGGKRKKLHNSKICEFVVIVSSCWCFTGGFEGCCAASLESVGSFMVHQCGSEGKALKRKSSSVNTGFVFYIVLMAGLAKKGCCVSDLLLHHSSDLLCTLPLSREPSSERSAWCL